MNRKLIFLLTVGCLFMIAGGSSITNAQFVEINNLKQYDHILQPTQVILKWDTPIPKNEISSFELIKIHFRAMDVFAVGFPVDYKIDITVREPNIMNELYLIYREPDTEISHINATNFEEFLELEKSLGNVFKIEKISPTKFYLEGIRKFQAQHEYGFSLLGKLQDNKIEPLDLTHETLTIGESVKKIQIDVARAELISTEKQYSNSLIILGFSAIIVGWIPLELFIQLYRESRREELIKNKAINTVISELKLVQEHYKNKKPVLGKEGEKIKTITPTRFSSIGLDNMILGGIYQNLEDSDREKLSEIYQEFKSITHLGDQLENVAFLTDSSDKKKNLENIAEACEKKYDEVIESVNEFLPKLSKYLNK